jgi:hypothetical protein
MDQRVEELQARHRACAQEAKRLIARSAQSGTALTSSERARLDQLHVEREAIDAELERALRSPGEPSA